jgi:glycosyltransferase involved in cell wall biosynthesis
MSRIAVLIPAYNEEVSIETVLEDIQAVTLEQGLDLEAVVINDCSTDNTSTLVSARGCRMLELPINLGIGGAVQTGLRYAYTCGFDLAVQIDGDGQHPASELKHLLLARETHGWNIVIGSRFIDKKGFQSSRARRTGIRFFRRLTKALTGLDITDSTSGFRLFDRKAMELALDYYPDEYPEPESLVYFACRGLSIGEVPVSMRERYGGVSSIQRAGSLYYMLKVSLASIFTRIRIKKI